MAFNCNNFPLILKKSEILVDGESQRVSKY